MREKVCNSFWHSASATRRACADKLFAGQKNLSNQSGYKVQLVVVCGQERDIAARVIEIDENWLSEIA